MRRQNNNQGDDHAQDDYSSHCYGNIDGWVQFQQFSATVEIGEARRYFTEAVGNYGKYYSINQSDAQEYSVEDPSIATISNFPETKGQLTGLKAGTTIVYSSFDYGGFVYWDETTVTIIP